MGSTRSSIVVSALALVIGVGCGGGGDGDGTQMMMPPTTGTIEGAVTDDAGAAIQGLDVRLRERGASSNLSSDVTDPSGEYAFQDVDPGDYDILVEPTSIYELNGQANPVEVSVEAGETVTADFTLQLLAGSVSGTVVDTASDPIQGANVELRTAGLSVAQRTTATDASGEYSFARVPIGDYDIFVDPPSGFQVEPPNPVGVTVEEDSTALADFTLSVAPVSFSGQVQPVFTNNCAFAGCHGNSNPQPVGGPMVLVSGQAYANIVNVPATQLPSMDRIEPGEPDSSYLVHKIQGTQGDVGGSGSRMPEGAPALDQETIDMIRLWVDEGADDN